MPDYTEIARSYLAGAGLGTSQFNILAGLAQAEQDRRVQQEQFSQRQDLDEREFGLRQQDVLARLGFAEDDQRMQQERLAWEQQLAQQQEQALQGLRAWARERALRAGTMPTPTPGPWAPGTPGTVADPSAMGAQPPDGPVAPQVLDQFQGAGGATLHPATTGMLRLIDNADGNALRAIMPYLDDMEQQQKLDSVLRGIDEHIGQVGVLSDPDQRAMYGAFKAARDPNAMLRLAMGEVEQRQSHARALQIGAVMGVPADVASVLGEAGLRQLAAQQQRPQTGEATQLRWEVEQAAEEYKALSGEGDKAGVLAPPTDEDFEAAATSDIDADTGFWGDWSGKNKHDIDVVRKARTKVAAWKRYQAALTRAQGNGGGPGTAAAAPTQPTDLRTAAAQVVQQFTAANGRSPTREEFKQLMGGSQ